MVVMVNDHDRLFELTGARICCIMMLLLPIYSIDVLDEFNKHHFDAENREWMHVTRSYINSHSSDLLRENFLLLLCHQICKYHY